MDYQLTEHARESLQKRPSIRLEWVERILIQPDRLNQTTLIRHWNIVLVVYMRLRGERCG